MINKKIAVLFTVLFLFPAFVYAGGKNFVSLLSGMSGTPSQKQSDGNISKSFVGQSVVFKEVMNKDLIANSGFASAVSRVQNQNISFEMETDITQAFSSQVVPLKMKIATTVGNIIKIKYQILIDSSTDKWQETEYKQFIHGPTAYFDDSINFSTTTNYIKFYAINDVEGESGSFSPVYTIRLSTDVIVGDVKIVSPDPLLKLSSLNPQIQTTPFDIKHTSATVRLDEENSKLYEVTISSEDVKGMYDIKTNRIDYLNSDILSREKPGRSKLYNNKEYTLKIILWNIKESEDSDEPLTLKVQFKALDGGVTDVLTYPSPFNPKKGEKIKIRYILANNSRVTIRLYDKAGKLVCKLLDNADKPAGTNEDEWDGRNYAGDTLATGAYICEIIAKASDGEHRRYTALAIVGK